MEIQSAFELPKHYEKYLGEIAGGWSDDTSDHGIQVVCFRSQPEYGVTTYATLGLSNYELKMSSANIRQEILMSVNSNFQEPKIAGFLLTFSELVLAREKALLRGEVIDSSDMLFHDTALTSVYVTNPSPLNEGLIKHGAEDAPIIFAYVIPISKAESALVRKLGWRWFEAQLEDQNPDIWNLQRPAMT